MARLKSIFLLTVFFVLSCSTGTDKENKLVEKDDISQPDISVLAKQADSLYQNDIYSEAFKAYTTLINLDSLNGEFYYRRAYSSAHLPEPEFIPEDYQQAAKLGYREFDSYYNLGVIYSIIKRNDSLAIYYFEKALEEKPDSETVRLMLKNLREEEDDKSI